MVSFFLSFSFPFDWWNDPKIKCTHTHTFQSNIQKSHFVQNANCIDRSVNTRIKWSIRIWSDLIWSIYIHKRHSNSTNFSTKTVQTKEASKLSPTSKQAVYNIFLFYLVMNINKLWFRLSCSFLSFLFARFSLTLYLFLTCVTDIHYNFWHLVAFRTKQINTKHDSPTINFITIYTYSCPNLCSPKFQQIRSSIKIENFRPFSLFRCFIQLIYPSGCCWCICVWIVYNTNVHDTYTHTCTQKKKKIVQIPNTNSRNKQQSHIL